MFATSGGAPDIQISPTGTLTAKLAPNANGQAIVEITAFDNFVVNPQTGQIDELATGKSVPQTFTITVSPVNDAPVFNVPANLGTARGPYSLNVDEDAGLQQFVVATDIKPGPATATDEGQSVGLDRRGLGEPSQASLFQFAPTVSADGTLRFSAKDNASTPVGQPVLVRLRAVDNGLAQSPNVNTSTPITLSINIREINDAPVPFNDPAPQVAALYRTSEDTVLRVDPLGILINDTDVEGQPLRVVGLGSTGGLSGVTARGATITWVLMGP